MMRDLSGFTNALINAHCEGGCFAPGQEVPVSIEEAYSVHETLIRSLGPVGGFKVSQKPGQGPTMAPIPERYCFPSGAQVLCPPRIGVELEVGFVVTAPLPDPSSSDFRARLIHSVRPAPMIELVSSRLTGPVAEAPDPKLADLQGNAALICGPIVEDWDGRDFSTPDIVLRAENEEIVLCMGQVPGGSALRALETLVLLAHSHCGGLQVGHRVLTGTLHPVAMIETGKTLRGSMAGLGNVSVQLT